jgi:(S)-citramalyl-CoA lyase
MKPRSLLYTSAIRPERFKNLSASGAHAGVIDLEDGVPAAARTQARAHLRDYLAERESGMELAVRINPIDSLDGLHDLLFLASQQLWPDTLVLSMVPGPSHIDVLRALLDQMRPGVPPKILVTIERPDGIANVSDIARGVDGLVFGSADYCAALGISIGGGAKLQYARCSIVNAAARFDIPAYDTACFQIDSMVALEEESERAKELGFFGKTAVHPRQIAAINRIFTPSPGEVEEARRLIQFYENAGAGIVRNDDGMVGPPFYQLAKKLIEA